MADTRTASLLDDPMVKTVDLERYPIDDLKSPAGRALIARMHEELGESGACCLRNFIGPEALEKLRREAEDVAPLAYGGPREATPYFFNYRIGEGKGYSEDHPTRRTSPRRLAQVAGDLIPEESLLHRLHRSPGMAAFLAKALGEPALYPLADRQQSLNISVMEEGGCQQWHFDRGKAVITLLAQAPEGGGHFEYVPNIRSDDSENFQAVSRVLDGNREYVRTVGLTAGTLMLFRGHYALHRVTPVEGKRRRLQLILSYADRPDQRGSAESGRLHYGARAVAGAKPY
jgi:hypothetical protein